MYNMTLIGPVASTKSYNPYNIMGLWVLGLFKVRKKNVIDSDGLRYCSVHGKGYEVK